MLSQYWQRTLTFPGDELLSEGVTAALSDLAAKLRLDSSKAIASLGLRSLSLLTLADPKSVRRILADQLDSIGGPSGLPFDEAMDLAYVALHYFWATLDYPFMVQHGAALLIEQSRLIRSYRHPDSDHTPTMAPSREALLLGETIRICRLIDQARRFSRLEEQAGLTRSELADLASLADAMRTPEALASAWQIPTLSDDCVHVPDFFLLRQSTANDGSSFQPAATKPAIDPLFVLQVGYLSLAGLQLASDRLTLSPRTLSGLDQFTCQFHYCSSRIQLSVASGQGRLVLMDGPAQAIQIYDDEYMLEDELTFPVAPGFP